jgi:hypothetical protein
MPSRDVQLDAGEEATPMSRSTSEPEDERQATPGAPRRRADRPGAWITAGCIGVAFAYFLYEALELPTDIQRWPLALCVTGFVLLVIYLLQQRALAAGWKVVDTLATEEPSGDGGGGRLEGLADDLGDDARAALSDDSNGEDEDDRDATQYGSAADYTRRGDLETTGAFFSFVAFAVVAYGFGFLPAILVFVPGYMLANGERRVVRLVAMTLLAAVMFFFLFDFVLNASLTRGEWFRTDWMTDWIPR